MINRLILILICLPLSAGAGSLAERLRALTPPPDPYATEKADDLARIAAEPALFPNDEAIALFTRPDCPACAQAEAELKALGLAVQIIDISELENAELMQRLTLDIVPSYVMPDRLIRGHMPSFVLKRYLNP